MLHDLFTKTLPNYVAGIAVMVVHKQVAPIQYWWYVMNNLVIATAEPFSFV